MVPGLSTNRSCPAFSEISNDYVRLLRRSRRNRHTADHGDGLVQDFHLFPGKPSAILAHNLCECKDKEAIPNQAHTANRVCCFSQSLSGFAEFHHQTVRQNFGQQPIELEKHPRRIYTPSFSGQHHGTVCHLIRVTIRQRVKGM